jgi:hypothetical protein
MISKMFYGLLIVIGIFALYLFWSVKNAREYNATIQAEPDDQTLIEDTTSITDLMHEDKFWSIIDNSRNRSGGNYEKQCQLLTQLLKAEPRDDLIKFSNAFVTLQNEAYDWKLWAAAYIINGGCSDDCFSDFRSWLIGQGKTAFENAVKDPETLLQLQIEPDNWEGLQYAAMEAYQAKTGKEMPFAKLNLKQEPSGEQWNEDEQELKKLLPKLYEKYGN